MTALARASRRWTPAVAALLALLAARPARTQERRVWPAPLDRRVALHARDVSLREALDRLAAAAGLRFSYSSEALPLDHTVRVAADTAAVGDLLAELLRGIAVIPVIAGPDQIVLAPSDPVRADTARLTTPRTLDRVVVTGTAGGGPERPLTVAVNVVRGEELERSGASTMSQAMDFFVPGMWLWNQSPSSLLASYGSIRGASSFGVTYPKVYIDGIEVANPLLLTQLVPENVDRIEVIRGPQGAALYGADAISGVVNIITRHDGNEPGERGARLRSVAGVSQSDFADRAIASQEHALSLRAGTGGRSAGFDLAVGSFGAFYEGAASRHVSANGTARLIGARTTLSGTARFFVKQAGASTNPLLPRTGDALRDTTAPQSVTEYTIGATLRHTSSERWTHSLVAGLDGYRLANVAQAFLPFPSSTDSALRAARGGANRATIRASSVVQLAETNDAAASLTLAAEQSLLREAIPVTPNDPRREHGGDERTLVDWLSATGVSAQTDLALRRSVYFTGGLRVERSNAFAGDVQYSMLPMLGTALVRDYGDVSVKLRLAYGRGIRAPRTPSRERMFGGLRTPPSLTNLAPEEQAGTEAGFDLFVGRALTFQVTRFDQRASGLIQQVPIGVYTPPNNSGPGGDRSRVLFQLQNVGAIDNRGWEMQGTVRGGPFSLATALTFVDSRVRRVAYGYSGDLREGDRMFDVPSRTLTVSGSWEWRGWSAVAGAARAFDWVDYDRLALTNVLATSTTPPSTLFGAPWRAYWRHYDGVTRLRASLNRSLGRGIGLVLNGENLLGDQRGEPDNVTIIPGRTVMVGLRAAF